MLFDTVVITSSAEVPAWKKQIQPWLKIITNQQTYHKLIENGFVSFIRFDCIVDFAAPSVARQKKTQEPESKDDFFMFT